MKQEKPTDNKNGNSPEQQAAGNTQPERSPKRGPNIAEQLLVSTEEVSRDKMNKKCRATTETGKSCDAKPLSGSDFCYFHDPDKAEERKAASSAGGKAGTPKTLPPDTPWMPVRTPGEVNQLIEATINRVVRGEIGHQVANSIAILLGLQLKALELRMDAERLDALEVLVEDDRRSALLGRRSK